MISPSHKLGTARATSHTALPPPRTLFCCFCLKDKLPISDLKARGFLWNIIVMYCLGFKSLYTINRVVSYHNNPSFVLEIQ
ncbi:hypothetical protein MTR_1g066910 [Medicago truncatula]|uniref:Uncharacterized protein n=1 Tax=Medicago truncatula TaxID=3880 RepID=A0A072VW23_MEDTR|nr:hypothetical protein MTR_1g066910 [Medicago truncatula]